MKVHTAKQLRNGAKSNDSKTLTTTQPLQFIPKKKKDEEWAAWNMDWLEWNGLKQIKQNSRRLSKNYRLAKGIIDKTDYIVEENNDMKPIVEQLAKSNEIEAMELKFYPIIPNVIDTLVGEFAKRNSRVMFKTVNDEYTFNELLEAKRSAIEHTLVTKKQNELQKKMLEQFQVMMQEAQASGQDVAEMQAQFEQSLGEQLSEDNIKSLPEIQEFFTKKYQVIAEIWAQKQCDIDSQRFCMDELEKNAFRDKLVADREFWHMQMYEDDYNVELWNPITTFYRKSPNEQYISNASFVGHIDLLTIADVIDMYGWRMTEDQLESLESKFNDTSGFYNMPGKANDGSFYDASKSYKWNTQGPSLAMRQYVSSGAPLGGIDIIDELIAGSEDANELYSMNYCRVTTAYWKSQVKVGYLTRISGSGQIETDIVSEHYKITEEPIYDTSFFENKDSKNLVYGEHIDWIWINQTYGGIKIGPNTPTAYGIENHVGLSPIYLGINQNKIGPLQYQFKGDNTLYGCKLPVEGRIFSDRNVESLSIVDRLKPFQIGYNIVNNQISDILVNELGTVILLDQNALPKHSLGEDWGPGNLAKAYVAMQDFSILPLDTSLANTENSLQFQHYQQLDLSQTNRLLSRIQLANYFKQQAFEQIGLSPQRMGQAIGQKVSASEAEQVQVGSYAQTESHFVEHCDELMPRVHKMRTDLAQYYASRKPSVRIAYSMTEDERVFTEINGTDLLLRDIGVECTTKANYRRLKEQLQQLAINNNTTGASLYDLGRMMQADSIGSLNNILKQSEQKAIRQAQEERQAQQKMQDQKLQVELQEKQMERDFNALEREKDRRKEIMVAQIRAAGYTATQDYNQNKENDYSDFMKEMRASDEFKQTMEGEKERRTIQKEANNNRENIKREELNLKREVAQKQLEIAKINKNRFDIPSRTKKGTENKTQGTKKEK